ncbi:hypothetical protein A9R05_44190 (plasmid) [Burkholderia sp. KK1]|nr:hypothetical protein A9R05_44190 [Burkholderia sp. KK1]
MESGMEKRTVFFTMVLHPVTGWTRVGNAYSSRETASGWLSFVRGAWRGCRVKVSQCTLRFKNGVLTEKSRQILDQKFNLEPPDVTAKDAEK